MGHSNMNAGYLLGGIVLLAALGITARVVWQHQENMMPTDVVGNKQASEAEFTIIDQPVTNEPDRDDAALNAMIEDMEKDRVEQRMIRALKMRKQETDLELEEQKSRAELNRLRNLNPPQEAKAGDTSNLDVKIIYLGGNETDKEAILSVNGSSYSVKVRDRILEDFEVVSITDTGVIMRSLKAPFQTATYQFKVG